MRDSMTYYKEPTLYEWVFDVLVHIYIYLYVCTIHGYDIYVDIYVCICLY